jgi:hypothetical protein
MMPNATKTNVNYAAFINQLSNKSLAIVYCYSNTIDKRRTWYDRWKSSVIMYFGQGAEALGLEVRYVDVDTFLSEMAHADRFPNDYIINLNSGLNHISSWPIISSLASWRNVPAGPCPSDVHITCERKDVTHAIAMPLAMKLPKSWVEGDTSGRDFVVKERDLGMSVGLKKTSNVNILKTMNSQDRFIVEEFITGFDATIALLANASGSYTVLGARYCNPKNKNPHDWMFTEELKNLPFVNDKYSTEIIFVDDGLAIELKKLARLLGNGAVYRFDFRVDPEVNGQVPKTMTLSNSWFLEATPTPTMAKETDFGSMMQSAFDDPDILNDLVATSVDHFDGPFAPQSVLVANILFKSTNNIASN